MEIIPKAWFDYIDSVSVHTDKIWKAIQELEKMGIKIKVIEFDWTGLKDISDFL